jgi:hypothetical protein
MAIWFSNGGKETMIFSTARFVRGCAATAAVAGAVTLLTGPVGAQTSPAMVVLLDKDAIATATLPGEPTDAQINATIAAIGARDSLPFFAARVGQHMVLPGGQDGSEGWFALTSTPATWASTPGAADGLENFIWAGAGLGSPDENGDRDSLLADVEGVTPLQAEGLEMLVGQPVCALAFASDLLWTATSMSLAGANLGLVPFRVVSLDYAGGPTLPSVGVEILSPDTCSGPLGLLANAPDPN